MKHKLILLLIFLYSFASWANAQSREELSKKTKTTRSEKRENRGKVQYQDRWFELGIADETWGLSYSYSPHFPVGIGTNYTTSYFSIGGELGFTCSKKEYEIKTNSTAKPVCYLMATPGFYCKYVSINCGLGLLLDMRTKYEKLRNNINYDKYQLTVNGETISESSNTQAEDVYSSITTTSTGINLCIKPSITGYIPICDGDYYITLNAGYMFVPKIKDLNGFTCGIGFQITL